MYSYVFNWNAMETIQLISVIFKEFLHIRGTQLQNTILINCVQYHSAISIL